MKIVSQKYFGAFLFVSLTLALAESGWSCPPDPTGKTEDVRLRLQDQKLKSVDYVRVYKVASETHELLFYYRNDGDYSDTKKWRAFKDGSLQKRNYYIHGRSKNDPDGKYIEAIWTKSADQIDQKIDLRDHFGIECTLAEFCLLLQEQIVRQREKKKRLGKSN